jgi:hypothetical protein
LETERDSTSQPDWLDAELDNIPVSEDPTVAIATTSWGGIKALFR